MAEVVAPTVKVGLASLSLSRHCLRHTVSPQTPLEAFKVRRRGNAFSFRAHVWARPLQNHWNAIRNFYIDQQNNVEQGNIPAHLHGLVQILLTEDDGALLVVYCVAPHLTLSARA